MKRIILSVMVLAFAVAVQAGDATTCQDKGKDKAACCASKAKVSTEATTCCGSKVKVSTEAKDEGCPFAKAACCKQMAAKQTAVKQTALLSPKAAGEASK